MASVRERVAIRKAGRKKGGSQGKAGGRMVGMNGVVGVGNSIFVAAPAPATNLGGARGTLSEEKS